MLDEIGANARKRVVAIGETAEWVMATIGEDRSGPIGLQRSGRYQTEIGRHARAILARLGVTDSTYCSGKRSFRPSWTGRRLGGPRRRHGDDERGKTETGPETLSRAGASSRQNRTAMHRAAGANGTRRPAAGLEIYAVSEGRPTGPILPRQSGTIRIDILAPGWARIVNERLIAETRPPPRRSAISDRSSRRCRQQACGTFRSRAGSDR